MSNLNGSWTSWGRESIDGALEYVRAHKTARLDATASGGVDVPLDVERRCYFASHFPFELVARLLHRKNSPFQLRKIAAGERVYRTRPVLSMVAFKGIARDWPCAPLTDLHAGPAYRHQTQEPREGTYDMLGTELCLELDEPPRELAGIVPDKSKPADAPGNDGVLWWKWCRHAVPFTSRFCSVRCPMADSDWWNVGVPPPSWQTSSSLASIPTSLSTVDTRTDSPSASTR